MWFFTSDLFQFVVLHNDLNGIGVDEVVDLQLLGFAEHLDLGDLQLFLIQFFARLLCEVAQGKAIILHLVSHLIEAVSLDNLFEEVQVAVVGNDWILPLVTPLCVVVRTPSAEELGSVRQSFIWCRSFEASLHSKFN